MSFISTIQNEVNQKLSEIIPAEKINLESTSFARFGNKDHCWGIGHEWVFHGKKYWVYHFGSWKTGEKFDVQSWEGQQTEAFYKKMKQEVVTTEHKIEYIRHEKNEACKKEWLPIYESARQDFLHPYLDRKKIGRFNARLSKDQLLIPIYDELGFVGVQRIWPDGTKRFSSGIKIKGSFSPLKDFRKDDLGIVCEGFATAATIQEAFPDVPVIVAFSCHNIPEAIETIRFLNPKIKIIIAADADESGQGEKWAKIAQKRYPNVIYRLPSFPVKTKELSDFNDLAKLYGIKNVIDDLTVDKSEFLSIFPLGHDGDIYFYTSSENQQIVKLTARTHDEKGFVRLISNLSFWTKHYGYVDANEKQKISWANARSEYMGKCHEKGIFNEALIRGIGIWDDEGDIVISNGSKVENLNHVSRFHYPKKSPVNLEMIHGKDNHLMTVWNDSFSRLCTKNDASKAYLAAWYVQSFIFPIMDWKFHIWITGERGTGKSKILEFLQDAGLFIRGFKNTTVAALQGDCDHNQTAVVYDEAEGTSYMTKALVDFARHMTNNGSFRQSRGNAGGGSRSIDAHIVFAFGSIQDGIINAADRSRFFSVQLESTKNQKREDYKKISGGFKLAKDKKHEIWAHIYKCIPLIKRYFEFAKEQLFDDFESIDARQADQIGACMACLLPIQIEIDEELTDERMKEFYSDALSMLEIKYNANDYLQDNEEKETQTAFQDLCSTIVDKSTGMTIGHCLSFILQNDHKRPTSEQHLESFGLKIVKGDLFISGKNKNLLSSCKDYPRLAKLLQQDTDLFLRTSTARISGVTTKGIFISLRSFEPMPESDMNL